MANIWSCVDKPRNSQAGDNSQLNIQAEDPRTLMEKLIACLLEPEHIAVRYRFSDGIKVMLSNIVAINIVRAGRNDIVWGAAGCQIIQCISRWKMLGWTSADILRTFQVLLPTVESSSPGLGNVLDNRLLLYLDEPKHVEGRLLRAQR